MPTEKSKQKLLFIWGEKKITEDTVCVGTLIYQKSIFCSNVDVAYLKQVRLLCYGVHPLTQKRNILRASASGFDSPFSPNTCSHPKKFKKKKCWSVPQEERKNNTLISCTCKSWLLGKHPDCHLSLCWNGWHLAPVIFWSYLVSFRNHDAWRGRE